MGINELSMSPTAIPAIKERLLAFTAAQAHAAAKAATG
jgi:phosphoenolpyruvate-protein kinase (PTS system EI component)